MKKIEIIKKKNNPLMGREEVSVSVEHPGSSTPTRADLLPELAKKLGADKDLIIIDKIFTTAGTTASVVKAFVYKKKGDIPKDKLEKMARRLTKKPKSEAGAEEKAEEPKEEKPAEEEKEETKEKLKE